MAKNTECLIGWMDELRAHAVGCGFEGDIVSDVGADKWAEYYYDGYSVSEAFSDYFSNDFYLPN